MKSSWDPSRGRPEAFLAGQAMPAGLLGLRRGSPHAGAMMLFAVGGRNGSLHQKSIERGNVGRSGCRWLQRLGHRHVGSNEKGLQSRGGKDEKKTGRKVQETRPSRRRDRE